MTGLFRTQQPFLQTNAWQKPAANSLRYNTSQAGSVVPIAIGTVRIPVNLIALGNYMGPNGSGKKGKGTGPLPIGGQSVVGKGGGGKGGGKKGGKAGKSGANQHFTVDVDFGICRGPVSIQPTGKVWASANIAFWQSVGLHFYDGSDGQAADPVFSSKLGDTVGYSGTCHITGTPMDLGMSPVIPNLSFEITGFFAGTGGINYPLDANPALAIKGFLTDPRWGVGFPPANLDDIVTPNGGTSYIEYCWSAQFAISALLDGQQEAQEWLNALAKLLNTAIVWSGSLLKFIPYGDLLLSANGSTWTPNLTPVYAFTDNDFIPWHPASLSGEPQSGEEDPIIITRTNPSEAVNWVSMEYTERANSYVPTIMAVFDQGAIDQYGLRTGNNLQGKSFCSELPAQISAQIDLQRLQYIRNSPYKFQVGWKYAPLECMDIVTITGSAGDSYLVNQPVRIISIIENENGDLEIDAEEISTGAAAPQPTVTSGAVDFSGGTFLATPVTGGLFTNTSDTPLGTYSVWIDPAPYPTTGSMVRGLIRTNHIPQTQATANPKFAVAIEGNSSSPVIDGTTFLPGYGYLVITWAGNDYTSEHLTIISVDPIISAGVWQNLRIAWDMSNLSYTVYIDSNKINMVIVTIAGGGFVVPYSSVTNWQFYTVGGPFGIVDSYFGCTQDAYFNQGVMADISNPAPFGSTLAATKGTAPTGNAPTVFLHYDGNPKHLNGPMISYGTNLGTGGNLSVLADPLTVCSSTPY